jgi:uncharacterized damage-inducible protein DinB
MSIQKVMVSYAQYNHWANEKLSHWLMGLDRELLYRQTPSSFATVELTVQHMQQSQQFWLGIITTKGPALPDETDSAATHFSRLLTGSKQMLDAFGAFTEKELLELVASTDMVQSRCAFILHTINHNSYHRGQIVTMCRRLGVVDNIPAMDYEVFLWSGRADGG